MIIEMSPSKLAVATPCPRCGAEMTLRLVEPHPLLGASGLDRHTFHCTSCDLTRTCVIGPGPQRTGSSDRPRKAQA